MRRGGAIGPQCRRPFCFRKVGRRAPEFCDHCAKAMEEDELAGLLTACHAPFFAAWEPEVLRDGEPMPSPRVGGTVMRELERESTARAIAVALWRRLRPEYAKVAMVERSRGDWTWEYARDAA